MYWYCVWPWKCPWAVGKYWNWGMGCKKNIKHRGDKKWKFPKFGDGLLHRYGLFHGHLRYVVLSWLNERKCLVRVLSWRLLLWIDLSRNNNRKKIYFENPFNWIASDFTWRCSAIPDKLKQYLNWTWTFHPASKE